MLKNLKVKNYALISDVDLHFNAGLNIITGETGAGKSILMDALGLVLGNRADSSSLRNHDKKCVVEALFDPTGLQLGTFYLDHDLDEEPELIIRREITPSGKSRMFINDTPVNLKVLALLGTQLLEVHSQYDNLQLFTKAFQFELLDVLSGAGDLSRVYRSSFEEYKLKVQHFETLQTQANKLQQEREFNQFLFNELEAADLSSVDEEGLEKERLMLENAESLIASLQQVQFNLSEMEPSILSQIADTQQLIREGGSLTESLSTRMKAVEIELQDIVGELNQLASQVEVNPQRLERVNERWNQLFQLKSKHRLTAVSDLVQMMEALEKKLVEGDDLESELTELERSLKSAQITLEQKARALSDLRQNGKRSLEEKLNKELERVGMTHSRIQIQLTQIPSIGPWGVDELALMLSADKGLNFGPLKRTASGGELSRINLVIKNVLAQHRSLPASVFDEIDSGVSGEVARKVGGVMLEMAKNQQLIVITHLPQIASLGAHHFKVYKSETEGKVKTQVISLNPQERIHEIAQMISGENLTESALEQSKELLKG